MSSSSSLFKQRYDVFLSFRGLDTRLKFTAQLHYALKNNQIKPFYDDEECETGEPLKPVLEEAIKNSRASVIVISTNFASSTWCLDELVSILHQRRTTSHIVFPIFYCVEPTDVRKQENSFFFAIEEHKKKMEAEPNTKKKREWAQKIDKWEKALTEVANLKGYPHTYVDTMEEPEFIQEIIKNILRRLSILLGKDQRDLIGVDDHVDFISSWLKDGSTHTADILTIYGMGGVGKTSLAQYIYFHYYDLFQRDIFIGDIKENLLNTKKQYFQDVLKPSSVPNNDKRVFVVLDNIESLHQLDELLGNRGFHPGSKIIITTRDGSLTERFALSRSSQVQPKHTKLLHEGLDRTASLQLLCSNAFKCDSPREGYKNVCQKLVKYCEGHPKALEVLVDDLRGRDADYWEARIKDWKNSDIPSTMVKILQRSFDSLEYVDDKELFKHVAFFFAGKDRIFVETILDEIGMTSMKTRIQNLTDRCVLTIGPRNELRMHQLLQVLGRQKGPQESTNYPWMCSRLWCYKDSYKVLAKDRNKDNLFGMLFDRKVYEKKYKHVAAQYYLRKMNNLKLLQLNHVQPNWSDDDFPEELIWLCMHGFPLESKFIHLPMNLVALDLSYSKIKVFNMSDNKEQHLDKTPQLIKSNFRDKPLLPSLKILNLSFCDQLNSVCGFLELPALERLILDGCSSLTKICETIEGCNRFVFVDLSYCRSFKEFTRVFRLQNLTELSLYGLRGFTEDYISRLRWAGMPKLKINLDKKEDRFSRKSRG